jgi:hypothetical protein
MTKPVYTIGTHPISKPLQSNPTTLLQAQSLGYIKRITTSSAPYPIKIPVLNIYETIHGFQIELDQDFG